VTIINHPDVRRMLLSMRANTEAARALAYHCGLAIDTARHSDDEAVKAAASARVNLLTPIVKAWITDLASETASTGVQVFGGVGYIEEAGAAQHMRDARVLQIYEGTNGIQALDLVFRKLVHDQGAAFRTMTDEINAFLQSWPKDLPEAFKDIHDNLAEALAALMHSALWLLQNGKTAPTLAAASATPFLRLFGNTVGGYYLARSALLAQEDLTAKQGDAEFMKAKIITARFFATHVLPQCLALEKTVREGSSATLASTEATF
jgi:hypothetical protein